MNKAALRDAILEKLRAELEQQTAAAHLARDEAISEESRPENQYDMHSQEAAYLAEGQARLAAEIAENIAQFSTLSFAPLSPEAPVSLGAVVQLGQRGRPLHYFVGPKAGGLEVNVEGIEVLVITPHSPLGRQLLGKRTGEFVQIPGRPAQPILRIE